jgi:hypothetical protein
MTLTIRCTLIQLLSDGANYGVRFEETHPTPPVRIPVLLAPASPALAATFTISSIYTLTLT